MASKDQQLELKRAYQRLFDTDDGKLVLTDLKKFCRANIPTFEADDPNGRISAFREGRREVWLRLEAWLSVTEVEIEKRSL